MSATDEVLPDSAVASVHALGDHEVLAGAHGRKELETLKTAPDAKARTLEHREAVDAAPLEIDLSRVEVADTVQAVEQRRFARAVRTDEADRLTGLEGESDPVERDDAPEGLGEDSSLQERHLADRLGVTARGDEQLDSSTLLPLDDALWV